MPPSAGLSTTATAFTTSSPPGAFATRGVAPGGRRCSSGGRARVLYRSLDQDSALGVSLVLLRCGALAEAEQTIRREVGVALVDCAVPASRAARVDPLVALREE